jgi:hypothetical protein
VCHVGRPTMSLTHGPHLAGFKASRDAFKPGRKPSLELRTNYQNTSTRNLPKGEAICPVFTVTGATSFTRVSCDTNYQNTSTRNLPKGEAICPVFTVTGATSFISTRVSCDTNMPLLTGVVGPPTATSMMYQVTLIRPQANRCLQSMCLRPRMLTPAAIDHSLQLIDFNCL